jgi:DNA polymerase-3 subunit gamma/tau
VVTALYRRYRPESFAELIGQSQVTAPLMTALRADRVNHAYLFSGPRGCGKTTSARILARCLNCAEGPTDTPCGVCPSCVDLSRDGGGSLDVVEIDAASHNGVDDARDLRERAIFAPVRDRYKIFILDEAHMVTPQGFNALLKIVEEPPAHVKFIFATTEPEKVIGTIRSRTHHYPFRLVPPAQMLEYLEQVCESEGVEVAPGVLALVVRAGGGSVRDSLSLMDQLMAGSEGGRVEYELAAALLGFTHAELLNEVVDAFSQHNSGAVFEAVDRVIQTGQDPRRFVEDLLEHLRNLIIVISTGENAKAVLRGIPADELATMTTQAYRFGLAELTHAANVVSQSLNEMTGATSPKLHLELMCARVLVPAADVTEVGSLARLERLERRIGLGGGVADAEPAVVISQPVRAAAAAPTASVPAAPVVAPVVPQATVPAPVATAATPAPSSVGQLTLASVQSEWPGILKELAKISRGTWVMAQTIKVAGYADGVLTLEFATTAESETFKKAPNGPANLRQAIQNVLGTTPQFRATVAAAAAPRVTSSLPSMPAPGPAFSTPASAPAPAASPAPAPAVEPEPAPAETAPEQTPAPAAPKAKASKPAMGKVHTGATYGESLLREILGAKPVEDGKAGR